MRYFFRKNGSFVGEMVLEDNQKAFELGSLLGANYIKCFEDSSAFGKCSICGTWHPIDLLEVDVCTWCNYIKSIESWLSFYEDELEKHLDGDIDNYGEQFTITFKGRTLVLEFGASEDSYFVQGIRELLKELKEENQI